MKAVDAAFPSVTGRETSILTVQTKCAPLAFVLIITGLFKLEISTSGSKRLLNMTVTHHQIYDSYCICTIILPSVRCTIKSTMYDNLIILWHLVLSCNLDNKIWIMSVFKSFQQILLMRMKVTVTSWASKTSASCLMFQNKSLKKPA